MSCQTYDQNPTWRAGAFLALRVAPWVVFGPITGFFSEWALRTLRRGQPGRAALLVCTNILVVASIPALTALIAAYGIR